MALDMTAIAISQRFDAGRPGFRGLIRSYLSTIDAQAASTLTFRRQRSPARMHFRFPPRWNSGYTVEYFLHSILISLTSLGTAVKGSSLPSYSADM